MYDAMLSNDDLELSGMPPARYLVTQWLEIEIPPQAATPARTEIARSYNVNSAFGAQTGSKSDLSTDPAHIAAELGVKANMTVDEIDESRRNFALRNHPDRLPKLFNEVATIRMQIANAICDALKSTL